MAPIVIWLEAWSPSPRPTAGRPAIALVVSPVRSKLLAFDGQTAAAMVMDSIQIPRGSRTR